MYVWVDIYIYYYAYIICIHDIIANSHIKVTDRCYIRDIPQPQVDMKPQGLYMYNDIHNRLHQSDHAQSSCKLKRVGDELFTGA